MYTCLISVSNRSTDPPPEEAHDASNMRLVQLMLRYAFRVLHAVVPIRRTVLYSSIT